MATDTVKINDIASQLTTASRLVVSTDFFWVYMASGSQVKIPAEFVKAYLLNGMKPSVNSDGNWEIGGTDLGVAAKGKTPQFRGGVMGIEVSYDEGKTWTTAVEYTAMNPDLTALSEAYAKVTENESARQAAEETRQSQEAARQANEKTRQGNETQRQTDTAAAISNSEAQTKIAKSYNEHPPKIGDNDNWWSWDATSEAYYDTGIPSRGDTLYPTFTHEGNKLYITDTGGTVSQYVKKEGNKLTFEIYN